MDENAQRYLRALRRSGTTWEGCLKALAEECKDESRQTTLEIVNTLLAAHKADRDREEISKGYVCGKCKHPQSWHRYGGCVNSTPRILESGNQFDPQAQFCKEGCGWMDEELTPLSTRAIGPSYFTGVSSSL